MSLAKSRSRFSALTWISSVCSTDPLPPHSCPTVDGGTCVFPFTNGWSMLRKCNQGIFPQDLKLFLPVSVKMMAKASGVQLQQRPGPSVTLENALLKEVTWSFINFIYFTHMEFCKSTFTLIINALSFKTKAYLLRSATRGCLADGRGLWSKRSQLGHNLPGRLQSAKHGKILPCHLPHPGLASSHCHLWWIWS